MRHYDRAAFRHLDDAERYRDYEYLADDAWAGPNEHQAMWASSVARGGTSAWEPPSSRPAPAYGHPPPQPSYEGRGPRGLSAPRPGVRGFLSLLLHLSEGAQRAARALFGVHGLEHGTGGVDHRIHDDVCERLTHHRDVDATDVVVKVRRGVVTLSGVVATRLMKYLAEDTAADVFGVRDVDNRLKVSAPPPR